METCKGVKARGKAYFLSDLHLGARYFASRIEAERRVVAFLDSIAGSASEIYLLGDVLDYWFEYRYVVPRGHVRFFGKLAELADRGVKITWMIGNHDIWIFDYIPSELGVEVIDGALEREILGKRFFLAHGDGLGKRTPVFKAMRAIFRNRVCQKLYSGIHPRWTIPFALGWSRSSRKAGADERAEAEGRTGAESLLDFAESHHRSHPEIDFYIFGHVHFQARRELPGGGAALTLGGWISTFDYAEFDGNELKVSAWGGR
ncbi:MAG: UDP-2,3-diacylglucosamine diphosphatase [Muribaculaceae bacterium]|nr:UDP-2,3-diacylglucosamine diphosphatase [Muribaculaceae bacterium]